MKGRSSKIGRIQQCDGPCPTTFTTLLCSFSISGKTTHLKVEIVISLSLRIGPETRAVRRAPPPGFNQPHTDSRAMHRNEAWPSPFLSIQSRIYKVTSHLLSDSLTVGRFQAGRIGQDVKVTLRECLTSSAAREVALFVLSAVLLFLD
ncbi:unnamed protein product [Dovyalis caffra]|uniref:Uncharacterized protein n=1 Tax=Dovyalis caffra TaxID=77055 RepID=A0AAV1QRJ2_9ROSI|nr:unnamed protein product [Dovyalis caffra]